MFFELWYVSVQVKQTVYKHLQLSTAREGRITYQVGKKERKKKKIPETNLLVLVVLTLPYSIDSLL